MAPTWHRRAIMKARAQITIDSEMQRRAKAKVAELGISLSEYVSRQLASDLGEPKPDISIVFDLCSSGEPTKIARDKDKMIGEAVWDEYLRKTGRKRHRNARSTKNRR
jgi:hypothetical protein